MTDILKYNRQAWDIQSENAASLWVQPVDSATINAARNGDWEVILTPNKNVPKAWLGDIRGTRVLCLASAGGQQAPILAAAGAMVTSFDNSSVQLAKDKLVADRDGLDIRLVQGDMSDLSCFSDTSFDLIFHPVSNVFSQTIRPVWQHCQRVLKDGGRLLSGFMNPDFVLFDHYDIAAGGPIEVRFALPNADIDLLDPTELAKRKASGVALEFSHSLDDQIAGQIDAGFIIAGFFEDKWDNAATPLNAYMPTSMATLALKTNNI
jgi:SAM-dependent methyltransferase